LFFLTVEDFHIYVTSYVPFFNEIDTDCDQTTFQFMNAAYQPKPNPDNVLLTTTVRAELNALVAQLNSVISELVDLLNVLNIGPQVLFVDMTDTWVNNQHRWCESGNFHEPDPTRADTWFFLSGWPDVNIETNALDTVCSRILYLCLRSNAVYCLSMLISCRTAQQRRRQNRPQSKH
jgi:hypothetical protein